MKRVSGTATVSAAALTLGAVNQSAINHVSSTFELGTFADANPNLGAGAFTVNISSWGDGTYDNTAGSVTETATGLFNVSGGHDYLTNGTYTVDWTVTATASGHYESASSSVEVGDALLGIPAELTWPTFNNSGGSTSPDAYTASEDWEDTYVNNTPSNSNFGTVSYSGSGNFLVTGEHTYEGVPVSPSVTIIDETDDFHTAKYADWTVYNAPIQASGEDITAVEGVPINVEVAKFTDPDPVVNGLDFSATVTADSGSATFSDTTVVREGTGVYAVYSKITDLVAETASVSVAIDQTIGIDDTVEEAMLRT